ncbi:MAG: DNA polymerase III subunit delta' [Proteobacteria bacterium]|nr:DNA polymerase III subunit delta' [Pseudomonadota bacterium]
MTPVPATGYRLAEEAPWLAPARERVAKAIAAGKLPHALLLQGPPGVGKAALADWIARLALCEAPGASACGSCGSCRQFEANSHPDLARLGLVEERKQIAVDDVRELIASLTLKSLRGGRKVAIVDPADALNVNGANALLKTLEEPTPGSLLILTVARPERLPATIASRCQRLPVPLPEPAVAQAWLAAVGGAGDWSAPLALAAGAPLAALALAAADAAGLKREMAELPAILSRPDADIVGLAERCQQRGAAERLRWIENWVTERIRRGLTTPAPDHSPATPGLPAAARTRHIQGLYGVLDDVRAAQAALKGPANVPMLFERVLLRLARELEVLRAQRTRG